jgi:hypothetical protein
MKSVILGAVILLFACMFIARAANAESLTAAPLAGCWAHDSDGFHYPTPDEPLNCYRTPAEAKAKALASCKKFSPVKDSCKILTCGWCGE